MQQASDAVAITLKKMREFAKPGISTQHLDDYGGELLAQIGARSAPMLTYGFPGYTCISINGEVAHGIPAADKILKEGDLVNIIHAGRESLVFVVLYVNHIQSIQRSAHLAVIGLGDDYQDIGGLGERLADGAQAQLQKLKASV